MSNVYLKNKTSSAITVSCYTVHYMDKTDAEIVEVEGADNITGSDDASGTIAAVTLPTAHSYTGVLFDSLRYYAKGTISNTGQTGSASKFNEDGYFVKGVATLKSNYNADTYAGYLQANPMMFVKYNQGVGLPFYFTIQSSMWSYENGVFSWLGNDTDTTDLAYWYKSAPDVQIILEKLPTA